MLTAINRIIYARIDELEAVEEDDHEPPARRRM
jgi:hypothetical protein